MIKPEIRFSEKIFGTRICLKLIHTVVPRKTPVSGFFCQSNFGSQAKAKAKVRRQN